MKKYNKLFAILFAVLGVQTLSAQTDVTSTYLTNAGFDDESGWITGNILQATAHAATNWVATSSGDTWWYGGAVGYGSSLTINSVTAPATNPEGAVEGGALGLSAGWGCIMKYTQEVTLPAGVYTLSYKAYNANTAATQANNYIGFISSSVTAYGKTTSFTANTWVEESVSFALTTETQGNISVGIGAISGGSGANAKLFVDGVTLTHKPFADVTEENPVDLTSCLKNPGFEDVTGGSGSVNIPSGWTIMHTLSGWLDGTGNTTNPSEGSKCYNIWAGDVTSIDMYQTVTLPAGKYKVLADLRTDNSNNITDQGVYAKVGDIVYKSGTIQTVAATWNSLEGWNTLEKVFNNGSEGEVVIGISSTGTSSGSAGWFQADNVRLMYYGYDLSEAKAQLDLLIETAQGIVTANVAAPKTIENLNVAIAAAQSVEQTEEGIKAASENLSNAITVANATVDAYALYIASLSACESIRDNSEEYEEGAKTTFSEAIESAKSAIAEAATVEAVNTVYSTLETARQTYVKKADPTNDTYFDYTFLVTNPGFDNAKEGWISTGGAQNKQIATNKTNGIITGNFYENWNGNPFTGEIYQTVSNLPSGIYKLKIAAFGAGANVYANDLQTDVTTGEGAWYEVDQVKVGNGTLKFGIKNENSATWMGIDNASLYYYGFDVETAQNSVTTLKADAQELVGKPMNAEVATALGEAIAGADASKATRNELEAMITDLSTAIANAEASIAAYEAISAYIAKANKIDVSIAADYQTAYDDGTLESAETVFQELEVATYDYVKDKFSYPVELPEGNWVAEGPTGSKSEQHWSGEQRSYLEQSDAAWGANAWSISYKQDKTLPAGDYVFKVSGRRAAGTGNTLSLVVTNINDPENPVELGVVNDFPEGDTGLGINKNGETSFDAEDEAGFANNNNGRGWQWRYVKFTLTNETKVQVAVEAEATTNHQWISFCDATLQMTEETYLEANMGALDAPTAAAEALVDTKPMGTEENTALKEALAMPVNTGAELLAKIEALETAVANANAWVAAYNEAKAPLVAALERFETDYNDGASGCLYHLQKDAWNTVILEVEDAVTAKDVTDSYDGFDDATTELVAALDAAQASIDMYAKLKAEIAYAQAYTPLIEGNAAGHTAAITAAQNAYDAAEIADASELILAMQNYKVLDYQYVVANYDKEFELGDWTGQTHTNNGEHWNGQDGATYFDYSKWSDGYKNGANEATQSVTLPAGDYVLMAAGRAASVDGTEAYIKVNETKVNYDARGGVGRGIDTDGTASFAENGTYANKDGRGWEYRFIEFTLTKTTEVTLTAGMVIDKDASSLSWAGVCTPVLLTRALDVTLEISDANWATLILPFDATLPEGVKAYSCGETEGENLTLVETESIEANTPYLVSGKKGSYNFSGYSLAEKDSYTVGLFTGTYVDYQTTAGSNTYVLQNGAEGVAFYLVGGDAQPMVRAYRCYMTYGAGTGAPVFRIGKGTTSIDNVQLTNDNVVIYDLMGRKVNTMVKGGMYIVNGKKVVIR